MQPAELLDVSAVAQATLLNRGDISALELTNLYLDRIERLNPDVMAFCHVSAKQARLAASNWDKKRTKGQQPKSLLSGVPIGIKDLSLVRWMPAKMGSRAFRYFVSPIDDPNVKRLRQAGLIILGKTTTSEFGGTPFIEPNIHAPTRNPWDLTRSPGGSSGGSGAAVAARLIPIAHGSDGGGSIRIPAALCGLVGFKPSRGALHHVMHPDRFRFATDGPIARSIEDIAAFSALLAIRPNEFQISPKPDRLFRIIFHTQSPLADTHPEIVDTIRRVASFLSYQGHDLEERPWAHFTEDEFMPLWGRTLANIPVLRESHLQPLTRWLREAGKKLKHQTAVEKVLQIQTQGEAWWQKDVDFHLSPTVACLAPPLQSASDEQPDQTMRRMIPLGAYTAMGNVLGYAAITLPLGMSQSGLPIGVQILAPKGHDAKLLEFSLQLERQLGGFQSANHMPFGLTHRASDK